MIEKKDFANSPFYVFLKGTRSQLVAMVVMRRSIMPLAVEICRGIE